MSRKELDPLSFELYERIFKEMLQVDFHNESEADITTVATKNFLLYASSVILGRAIPDLRDGLKPSQRRTIYSMKHLNISHSGSFKKSARITGTTIGLFHPHGDTSVYDTMVNLSQNWKFNLPLIDGQGNWGSIDGDKEASSRYTEARMTKTASIMFKDIDKDTVDFVPNYDGLELEPTVLPSPIPLILINGVLRGSIAVGMASSILPHNPGEVIKATIALINARKNNEEFTYQDFLNYVPGPDFPTGGIVYNIENMKNIVKTGRGSVKVRAKHHIEQIKSKEAIVVTEIPWGKEKPKLIQRIVDLKKVNKTNKYINAISNISDQSTTDIRIVIEVKKGIDAEKVWNTILKHTDFDTPIASFAIVIDQVENSKGELSPAPREYGLLDILNRYLDHRFIVVTRKFTYIKEKSEHRVHVLEGILKAIDHIDEVIKIIKSSRNPNSAAKNLMNTFELTEIQANAILAIRLAKLTSMEKTSLITEKKDLKKLIKECLSILSSYENQCDYLINELTELSKDVSYKRKTLIQHNVEEIEEEEIIHKENCALYITKKGYLKIVPEKFISTEEQTVKEGKEIELTEDDSIESLLFINTHTNILFVTNTGQVYGVKAFNLPDSQRGSFVKNIIDLQSNEKVIKILYTDNLDQDICFIMNDTNIKKSSLSDFSGMFRKTGVLGVKLLENAEINNVYLLNKDSSDSVLIATNSAKSIKFNVQEISLMGRNAKGVKSIKLKTDDFIIKDSLIVNEEDKLLLITEKGFVKTMFSKDFKLQSRAGVGMICSPLTKSSGNLSFIKKIEKDYITISTNVDKYKIDINFDKLKTKRLNQLLTLQDNEFILEID